MKNKKIPTKICIDYIPGDGLLCRRCKYFKKCPDDYVCPTLKRRLDDEFGEGNEE